VLDVARRPRRAYEALKAASQPVHIAMEYTAEGPVALWAINDLPRPLLNCFAQWEVRDGAGNVVTHGSVQQDIPAQRAHRLSLLRWRINPTQAYDVRLSLSQRDEIIAENHYDDPFHLPPRPAHYPWTVDPVLGMRCYGGPHAQSSLRVLNTWYGRIARALFPVYEWAEQLLSGGKIPPGPASWLRRIYARRD
jgi:hypothetical protein